LGPSEKIDELEIRWPAGETESIGKLAADRFVKIQEGKGVIEVTKKP